MPDMQPGQIPEGWTVIEVPGPEENPGARFWVRQVPPEEIARLFPLDLDIEIEEIHD